MPVTVQNKHRRRGSADRDESVVGPETLGPVCRPCERPPARNALEINRAIDRLTADIQAHYNHIRTELGFVSAMLVKNAVQGIAQKPRTLLALFREHNEEFGKRVGIDRTAESHASYVNSYKHLASFLHRKYGLEDIPLRHLDVKFYDTFDLYLRADCGMMQKSVHEHLYHLKKMTRRR